MNGAWKWGNFKFFNAFRTLKIPIWNRRLKFQTQSLEIRARSVASEVPNRKRPFHLTSFAVTKHNLKINFAKFSSNDFLLFESFETSKNCQFYWRVAFDKSFLWFLIRIRDRRTEIRNKHCKNFISKPYLLGMLVPK